MKDTAKKDVRDQIVEHLDNEDRTVAWLAKKTDMSYQSLYGILIRKAANLSDERLAAINKELETDFKQ